ncbi:MAG: type II toxin-antitoxin system VapC family toxin [Deltaproteobacteria bacterium]|nr:type II toxin-antitoxin system VapC family toxin [Deltaproteobacteria bacterium]
MKLLLDTHVWLWSLADTARLSKRTLRMLHASSTELWLSPISVRELGDLSDGGKFEHRGSFTEWIEQILERTRPIEAALDHRVALATRAIALTHNDPMDRFLAATARVYDLVLVTADESCSPAVASRHSRRETVHAVRDHSSDRDAVTQGTDQLRRLRFHCAARLRVAASRSAGVG